MSIRYTRLSISAASIPFSSSQPPMDHYTFQTGHMIKTIQTSFVVEHMHS